MTGFSSLLLSLAPLILFIISFLVTMFLLFRGQGVTKLKDLMAIFLAAPVSLKTWGLFLAAPTVFLMLNSIVTKMGDNSLWTHNQTVDLARIQFFREIGWGLVGLGSIILGAFGAVAFKGQLPGGASFQVSRDTETGQPVMTATGPAAAPAAPVPPVAPPAPRTEA